TPALLGRGPLAPATGTLEERAAAVRARIEQAVGEEFGDSAEDRELREALVRAYLEPAASPEQAAAGLQLSRAAYLRRLRTAVARVAARIATERRLEGG
ncbi:MAG: hypothetical protein ACXWZZ_07885, partial [Solirubrobacteraceae bacterium]